ncbi:MAG: Spy/CpxP family protein refolding chaperone, partial [Gemmatimonadota bacterium]|nr:Spy/CpxP family protein refolding chaperone [Gemmatimonadota bacterium]
GEKRQARGANGQHATRALLRGIELSDAQRTQVEAIRQRYAADFKAVRDSMRPALEQAREARQRGDSVAAHAALERTAVQRRQMSALSERVAADLRGILTPEQRTLFDTNLAAVKERAGKQAGERRERRRGR